MRQCVRCLVCGQVQGVWYRGATRQQAQRLGLTGYARNLPDGTVEVVACGEPEALAALQVWLWQGPSAARVEVVNSSACDVVDFDEFEIR